jgi:hypothetical protein
MTFFINITRLCESNMKLHRLNREFMAIRECHRAIMRARPNRLDGGNRRMIPSHPETKEIIAGMDSRAKGEGLQGKRPRSGL